MAGVHYAGHSGGPLEGPRMQGTKIIAGRISCTRQVIMQQDKKWEENKMIANVKTVEHRRDDAEGTWSGIFIC